jgi:hypothetical protein
MLLRDAKKLLVGYELESYYAVPDTVSSLFNTYLLVRKLGGILDSPIFDARQAEEPAPGL